MPDWSGFAPIQVASHQLYVVMNGENDYFYPHLSY